MTGESAMGWGGGNGINGYLAGGVQNSGLGGLVTFLCVCSAGALT